MTFQITSGRQSWLSSEQFPWNLHIRSGSFILQDYGKGGNCGLRLVGQTLYSYLHLPQLSLRPGQLSQGEILDTCHHLLSQPVVGEGSLGILFWRSVSHRLWLLLPLPGSKEVLPMDQDLASPAAAPTGWKQLGSTDIIFLGSKIIADGDCNHEIKKMLSPWKRSYGKPR